MRQAFACDRGLRSCRDSRPSPELYQFRIEQRCKRESAASDILVRFTKLSSRRRFSGAFQEPECLRLRT